MTTGDEDKLLWLSSGAAGQTILETTKCGSWNVLSLCRGCHWPYLNALFWNRSSSPYVTLSFSPASLGKIIVTVGVDHSWMFLVLLHCYCCAYTSDAFLCFNSTVHLLDSVTRAIFDSLSTDLVRHRIRSDPIIFSFRTLSLTCTMSQVGRLEEFDVTKCNVQIPTLNV